MTTKFKIGDKVITKTLIVFEIDTIRITKGLVEYSGLYETCYYAEEHLSLYTEPKPKVKKWFYLVKFMACAETMTASPFSSDDEVKNKYSNAQWVQRLDWSMTEVDDNE